MTRRRGTQKTDAVRRRLTLAQIHTLQQAETYGAKLVGVRTDEGNLPIVQIGDDYKALDEDGEFLHVNVRTGEDRRIGER